MESDLQMALGDATTLSKSRRGEGESDGGEVCLALLIVLLTSSFVHSTMDVPGERFLCQKQEQW